LRVEKEDIESEGRFRREKMKVPLSWLKEYIDVKLSARELAHRLTMAGVEVSHIQKSGKDTILELDLTTNRGDCASIVGVAREVSALINRPLRLPKISKKDKKQKGIIKVEIKDRKSCPRYTGRVIKNVRIKASPLWLKERLKSMEIKPINNIVDITNYVLFETGQPLHAFDLDKIVSPSVRQSVSPLKIIVRRAKKGEKITTLDGRERILNRNILVIADDKKAIALAGIMGGEDTQVTNKTRNILLESAYFDPIVVRRGTKKINLFSESSYRFERDVDPQGVLTASQRARDLILKLAGGEETAFVDRNLLPRKVKRITLRRERVNALLGIQLSWNQIKEILKRLEFKIRERKVEVPSYRRDVTREIDLIEEIVRIYGYHRIPSLLPEGKIISHPQHSLEISVPKIKEILVACGLREVINYGFVSFEETKKTGFAPRKIIKLTNPLTKKQNIMRPSLIPGLLKNLIHNLNQGNSIVKVFELGRVFSPGKERMALGVLLSGEGDLYDLKGILEALCEELAIPSPKISSTSLPFLLSGRGGKVLITNRKVGLLGEMDPKLLSYFGIEERAFVLELDLEKFLLKRKKKRFQELPRYPAIVRDIALSLPEEITSQEIVQTIYSLGGKLVEEVKFFDLYRGVQIPSGHKGLAYSISYRAQNRTLKDEEIKRLHQRISLGLEKNLGAKIRR
jgi:phenylalanyl-tRNA synthetase beta chain